jgi:proline iminopeptidase
MSTVAGPAVRTTRVAGLNVVTVGEGPALLVAHGGPGMHHGIYRTLDPLAAGRMLVFWDHRGHGASDPLPDRQVEIGDFADDVARLADGLGLEELALFGHSFGGWVAQEAAIRYPGLVRALVLAGTTPGQLGATESADDEQGPPPPDDVAALFQRPVETDADAEAVYRALGPYFVRGGDEPAYQHAIQQGDVSAASMRRVLEALGRWSVVDRLPSITAPTLLLAGRYDVFCSVEQHERIARRLPDPDLAVVDGVGHFLWIERPAVLDVVDDWLGRRGW